MIVKCGWCPKVLDEKEPFEDKSVTHGICISCAEKFRLSFAETMKRFPNKPPSAVKVVGG